LDSGGFVERLRRVPGVSAVPSLERFDTRNELHVDEAARHLLERFREHDDLEAFTLLFELTHEQLSQSAGRITRKLAPSVDPEELASAFMARLFTDVRRRQSDPVRHFLALAHTSMRNDVLDQLRQQKRAAANVRTWHATQVLPPDPAEELQRQEQDDLLAGFGQDVLQLTSECFAELDARDQQVLVAREIVRLPYERVASMLKLAPDQVGMIIRRARVHLVNRIVERLPARVAQRHAGAEDVAALQATVRSCLDAKTGAKAVKGLMQRMLEQSVAAARSKLADLVYEMAKACLVQAPGFASRTLIRTEPRRSEVVADEVRRMADRLREADAPVDVGRVALTRPAPATALDDTRACLQRLEQIEGVSGRQQVAVALCHIQAGECAAGEVVLRRLLQRDDLPPVTRQNAARNLQLALLRQERFAEALAAADEHADEWPDDPARVLNTCFAAARLADRERFERATIHLCAIQRDAPTERVADWLASLLPELARDLGLAENWSRAHLASCGLLPDGHGARPPADTGHAEP
jgi:RNA polymerase sigma factor (sigma-70 family)